MTPPKKPSNYGTAKDWTTILAGVGEGAQSATKGNAAHKQNKEDARQAKRRTLANLMNQAMRRNAALSRAGRENSDDLSDYKSQALQQVARGFVESMKGSTRG
jgi:hypothetical protein